VSASADGSESCAGPPQALANTKQISRNGTSSFLIIFRFSFDQVVGEADRLIGTRVPADHRVDSEDFPQHFGVDHLFTRPRFYDAALFHRDDVIGEAGRLIQIVEYEDDGSSLLFV